MAWNTIAFYLHHDQNKRNRIFKPTWNQNSGSDDSTNHKQTERERERKKPQNRKKLWMILQCDIFPPTVFLFILIYLLFINRIKSFADSPHAVKLYIELIDRFTFVSSLSSAVVFVVGFFAFHCTFNHFEREIDVKMNNETTARAIG